MKGTRVDRLEMRVSYLEQQVATVAAKVDALVEESKQQRQDIKSIETKFDKLNEHIQSMTVAAVVGFGAIVVAVGGLIIAVLK